MTGKFEGEYQIEPPNSGSVVASIDKLDDFNPADLVYDEDGIQIYKNDEATIMLKLISSNPVKFVSLYVGSPKITEEGMKAEYNAIAEDDI